MPPFTLRRLVLVLSFCAVGGLVSTSTADADPATFLDELSTNDVWLPGKDAVEVVDAGYAACAELSDGVSVLDEMSRVEALHRFQQGTLFVSAATTHLCPDFAG
ncbi:DUF732 domain-containing protein [Mycobacterium sp. SMC-4]|uniref:DUF732 domain-containing protein n=1 Tax=Mycobacterium sp. SMC-4 TaxID=2857059 RepID=UPI0021B270E0|nr:DUF732 domain-containing protein [Mycobacterium sp. SMC-4]UXA20338.1 DUF732 domain-containing protein [Mycobacterium sp. SMC-4]